MCFCNLGAQTLLHAFTLSMYLLLFKSKFSFWCQLSPHIPNGFY